MALGIKRSAILCKVLESRLGLNFTLFGRKNLHFASIFNMPIKSGDKLPSVDLYENTPATKVNIAEMTAGKKVIIFGVPGAFTPGCSKTHLPGYVSDFEKFKSKGIDEIVCVSVNDPFVMAAWGKDQNADGKVRMLADTNGAFAKATDLEKDLSGPLGSVRCQRFSMLVEDGVVKALNVEPDGTGLTCSLSNSILAQL
uniref:Peroxiredoxin-5 n=1 Tax=Daphnia galeata TaxID=27404 RepID=A0A8J2RT92_9CRUS|nr:unnamed protein product [Daphnia galeata]